MKNLFNIDEKVIMRSNLYKIDFQTKSKSDFSVGVSYMMSLFSNKIVTIREIIVYKNNYIYKIKEDPNDYVFSEFMLKKNVDKNNNFLLDFY
jgi:hypothetical protein